MSELLAIWMVSQWILELCPSLIEGSERPGHQNQRPLLYGLANTYFEKNIYETTKTISQFRIYTRNQ